MANKQDLEYAIIGGGIAGLTLGLALLQRAINVTIYEAAHHFGEIGAGVSLTPNSVQAMQICHPEIEAAFEKVRTRNAWPSKAKVWFEAYDGKRRAGPETSPHKGTLPSKMGNNGVHRARFLDELVKLFPTEHAHFGKRLEHYAPQGDGTYLLSFADGTTATAGAIIGCDGIKSHVRGSMFGFNHPCANPGYSHKVVYRALIPMKDAIDAVGEERALNASLYFGKDNHCLTFPINDNADCNFVGFHTDPNDWPHTDQLTAPAHREEAERFRWIQRRFEEWALFDLLDNPPPVWAKERVCIVGDAAHATTPNHGTGASMAIEDAAILAELLADPSVKSYQDVEAAFSVYDAVRRPRGEYLVRSSRFMGESYDFREPTIGGDIAKACDELNARNAKIWYVDVPQMCRDARTQLASVLSKS